MVLLGCVCWLWVSGVVRDASLDELAEGVRAEAACVALIGIDVSFQIEALVNANDDVIEGYRTWAVDLHLHGVEVLHTIEHGIVRVHVHVGLGADDSLVHFEISVRAHQHAARGSGL